MTASDPRKFPRVPGVVLAGGKSSRMGRVKGLLPWPATGAPFVLHVTSVLRDGGADPVAVVTGAHHDTMLPVLAREGVPALYNARHEEGQLASLQHGLAWAFGQTDGSWALVTLVDVPAVGVETVGTLIEAARHATARAVRPVVGDRHGHPVLWHRDTLPLLEQADPAQGARAVMHALVAAGQVLDVGVADAGVVRDIDTPDDYERISRQTSDLPGSGPT